MKKILALLLCVFAHNVLFSQDSESKKSIFQLSFVPPLSTNGMYASQYSNRFSFNILVGVSKNEEGFTFGGLSNIILENAKGIQFAGLSNHVGNEGRGFQFAGLANTNKGGFRGFQFSGLLNTASGMSGFQFSGLASLAKDVRGFQFSGLLNTASKMSGFQFSGLANLAKDVNVFQFAGLLNTASKMNGFQFSGLANTAKDVNGFQFAGLINVAKNVKGVQFAGLINIAENSDCPIGLVNIVKNGEKGIAVTYDAAGSTVISFRSGGKYTYGILGVGYNHKTEGNSFVAEGGFGAHIPVVSWFRVNNEIKVSSIGGSSSEPVLVTGYSLIPAFRIGKHFELFAGASVNYMESNDRDNDRVFPDHSLWKRYGSAKWQQLYIGYQFGCQYIF